MRKPRLQLVLAWTLIGAGIVWTIYDWIFVDEGLRYFSGDWSRILVLLAIVVVGTPILLGYESLSAEPKLRVALSVVGLLAAAATGFAVHFVISMARLASTLRQGSIFWCALLATMFPCIIAACLWWAFSRILNHKPV